MVVHALDERGNLLGVANLPCQRAQRRRGSGTRHPAQQRLQEEGFVGRAPSPRAGQAQHIAPPPDASVRPAVRGGVQPRTRRAGRRRRRTPRHTPAARRDRCASASTRHAGLQIAAAEPQTGRALFPRRARDLQRLAVGRGRRGGIVLLKLARFAFTLPAHERRCGRRSRAAVLPRRDHAVLHHAERRRRWESPAGGVCPTPRSGG